MFGLGRRDRRIRELEETLQRLTEAADQTLRHARLFDIRKENRSLKFYFMRNGEVIEIETLSPLGFDVARAKRELLP